MPGLESVLINIFEAPEDDHPMQRAIAAAGINKIEELTAMDRLTLKEIEWKEQDVTVRIPPAMVETVVWITRWYGDLKDRSENDYKSLT